jgi:sulfur carrier protein
VNVTVNGIEREFPEGTTVADVVAALVGPTGGPDAARGSDAARGPDAARGRGVAVAVNDEVVPRGSWAEVALGDGDTVEALTAVPGG